MIGEHRWISLCRRRSHPIRQPSRFGAGRAQPLAIIICHFPNLELVRKRYPHLELVRGRRRSPSGGAPRGPGLYGVRASAIARVGRR